MSGREIQRRYAGGRVASAGEVQRALVTAESIPGRGDALVPRPGEPVPEPVPSRFPSRCQAVAQPLPESRGPETVAIPMTAAPVGSFDPETAFLAPVADDPDAPAEHTSSAPPSGPETTVIPAVSRPRRPSVTDDAAHPTRRCAEPASRQRCPRRRPRPAPGRGRHRPDHTLADDIFELGDDDE